MKYRLTTTILILLIATSAYTQLSFDSRFKTEVLPIADTNGDGEISQAEADAIIELRLIGKSIGGYEDRFNFATGIEHFTNLRILRIEGHRFIVEMDLSMNKNLESIYIDESRITGEFSPQGPAGPTGRGFLACDLPNLKEFIVTSSNLERRDNGIILKGSPMLRKLDFTNNNIDISVSTDLEFIRHNPITSMDYTSFTQLDTLILTGGDEINCSGLSQLKYFSAFRAGLSLVNLTFCPQLDFIDVSNCNLEDLDISGSELVTEVIALGNDLTSFNYTSLVELNNLDLSSNNFANFTILSAPKLNILNLANNELVQLEITDTPLLESLDCSINKLMNLELPGSPNLKFLRCNNNELVNLNISNQILLQELFAGFNNLTMINTTNNTLLTRLNLSQNQLEEIDLNNNKELGLITLTQNNLSEFRLSGLPLLRQLVIADNNLTLLELTDLPLFIILTCSGNNLTRLDLSQLYELSSLNCQNNNLESLNVKNGNTENRIQLLGNDNLAYICADDLDNNIITAELIDTQLSEVVFNAFCSFDFGGPSKNISGKATYNQGLNECNGDTTGFAYTKYEVTIDSNSFFFIGNEDGTYNVDIPAESTNIKVTPTILIDQFSVSPENVDLSTLLQDESLVADFCITPVEDHENLEVILIPSEIRPGFTSEQTIRFSNLGNTLASGTIRLEYQGEFLILENSMPPHASDDNTVIEWTYNNLRPFETRYIKFELTANTPTATTNPLNGDEVLNFKTTIYPIVNDIEKENNIHCVSQTVVNSYDPNNKTCLQGTTLDINNLDNYVEYLINFENLGTASAVNVVVVDKINTQLFDINSLEIVEASHPMKTRITRNQVEFHFTDIFLPFEDELNDGSVLFRIKPNSDLVVGDVLQNQAEIYFDFNAPIITNNFETTIIEIIDFDNDGFNEDEDCDDTDPNVNAFAVEIPNNGIDEDCDGVDLISSSSSEIFGSNIVLYPNPTSDFITISSDDDYLYLQMDLYDAMGRKINLEFNNQTLDVSLLDSGVYILQIADQSSGEKTTKRIVVE